MSGLPIRRLAFELSKLPGIGARTSERLAHAILRKDPSYAEDLANAILSARRVMKFCRVCFLYAENDVCDLCERSDRDEKIICVLEQPSDLEAIESSGIFRGKYHCLHGLLSPMQGIGPDDLKMDALIERLNPGIDEVILALSPTVEGEATAWFLASAIKEKGIKATVLASGLSAGTSITYADRETVRRALQFRVSIGS